MTENTALSKLTAILDYNKYQEMGPISREMGLEPLAQKWESFGWNVEEVNGHDIEAVIAKLTALKQVTDKPSILIAHTIKGKGVSFLPSSVPTISGSLKRPFPLPRPICTASRGWFRSIRRWPIL